MVLRRYGRGIGLFLVGFVLALVFVWAIGGPVDAAGTHNRLRNRVTTLEDRVHWLERRTEKLAAYNGTYQGHIIFRQVLTPPGCEGQEVVWLDQGIGC